MTDKKATDINYYDLINNDYFADMVVLCNSLNNRHASSLIDALKTLKPDEEFLNVDDKSDEWIVADLGDIIVHIIDPEYRSWYDLDTFFEQVKHPPKVQNVADEA